MAAVTLVPTLSGCDSASSDDATTDNTLPLSACQLSSPGAAERLQAVCGELAVPADPSNPDAGTIDLRVAVVPAVNEQSRGDPLFLIAGGPGQAATEAFPPILRVFEQVREDRDIVMVDQRGTGASSPLVCPDTDDGRLTEPDDDALRAWTRSCLSALDADVAQFTTAHAVGDLEAVRQALGYEQVNLYGGSYGTRVALEYMRLHADRLRSVVLDGVLPPEAALGTAIARDAQTALDGWLERCSQEKACAAAFPDIRGDVDRLLSTLETDPVMVELPDPVTAEPTEVLMSRSVASGVLRMLSYSPAAAALIPVLVKRASDGDLAPLAAQHLMIGEQSADTMALGMHYATVCAEDVPFFDLSEVASLNQGTYLGDLVSHNLTVVCDEWPDVAVGDGFKQPVISDVPVLLLSGALDPVTPPANGDAVLAQLSRGHHVVAPGLGHGTIVHPCVHELVTTFVENGSADDFDTTCVDEIAQEPFFVNLTGSVPVADSAAVPLR